MRDDTCNLGWCYLWEALLWDSLIRLIPSPSPEGPLESSSDGFSRVKSLASRPWLFSTIHNTSTSESSFFAHLQGVGGSLLFKDWGQGGRVRGRIRMPHRKQHRRLFSSKESLYCASTIPSALPQIQAFLSSSLRASLLLKQPTTLATKLLQNYNINTATNSSN